MKFSLATRGSDLALWQARHVEARLRAAHPGLDVALVVVRTTGDRVHDAPLARIGTTGVFTREVDRVVLVGEADAAVHSLKDLPTSSEPGLAIAAVLEREDARDAFLPAPGRPATLQQLPSGARVGTSSLRRRSLLLAHRPDLLVEEFRGNLDTRLARLVHEEYDAAVLALAGLLRLGRAAAVGEVLNAPHWLPAAGQGALAVVTRDDDARARALVAPLDHAQTRTQVSAERALLERLRGGCQVPVGVLAVTTGDRLTLHGFVGSSDGRRVVRGRVEGACAEAEGVAATLAQMLERQGAAAIIAEARDALPFAPAPPAP